MSKKMETIVKTTEPKIADQNPETTPTNWRDIVYSGADFVQIEGFVLEHLIDLQRNHSRFAGEES